MDNKSSKNVVEIFTCKKCHYSTKRKYNYQKHLQTKKHNTTNTKPIDSKERFNCECGSSYMHRSSLYNHKKSCKNICNNIVNNSSNEELIEIIKNLLIQNSEMIENNNKKTDKIIELASKPTTTTNTNNTNTNTNCNINTFNLNTFLNVDCKDAINLSEFINGIKVTMKEFENIHNNDPIYIYNKCWIQPLMLMDQSKRPIHCTDKKRKNFAVKDNNLWERNKDTEHIKSGIMKVMNESCNTMNNWKLTNPDWNNSETKQDIINASTINIVKGYDSNMQNKIISKICELTIDK